MPWVDKQHMRATVQPASKSRSLKKASHKLVLVPQGGGSHVVVTLTAAPLLTELCPITCEEIGNPDTIVPYAPSDITPLHMQPHLSCATLVCGHRFHASALLVHFMRNRLLCPLCRAGTNAMPTKTCLPLRQEKWFRQTYEAIIKDIEVEEHAAIESDQALAREIVLEQTQSILQSFHANELNINLTATFLFYRSENSLPILGLELPLQLIVTPLQAGSPTFRLYNDQLRNISRAMNDIPNINSLSVDVYARHLAIPSAEPSPVANMQRTDVIAGESAETGLVLPAGNAMEFEAVVDAHGCFTLRSFVYKPSLAAIVYMYCNAVREP